ncbi:MAG: Serine/threonine protein kinase PrkC, regulator of stationary phase [Polyangiaceae bacterium]|nr:Serine/threonine protein kinase PrkC, regulator of stationary phase [Polyangiaceae bacterium]
MPVEPEKGQDAMIGQLIGGRYRITGILGEGGMGIVYVGEQQMGSTVRKVAIKTLHQHLSKDPSVLARFHRECGTVAQLEHPNTIKFYDFGATADGTLYIAMEFVAGRPLADLVQEGPMPPDRVIKIMRQVCGALDEAHMQGVIHRDLKPENIVLTNRAGETDFVKVLDFGIAARTESADAAKEAKLTQQGMVLGTPPYMSPEQFTGKALDARSDIYSLAVMSYEMLTGKLPFEADTPWQWATQHMTAQPIPFEVSAPAKNIPEGMRRAILKGLSKDRDQRESSAREFFTDLSDGGRMTVEANPAETAAAARTGTAAMDAVPAFVSSPAAAGPLMGSPHPAPTPMAVSAAPVPRAPQRTAGGGGGSGKGLIFGLVGVAAVLLGAIGIILMKGSKQDNTDLPPIAVNTTPATTSAAGPAEIKPLDPVPEPTPTTDPAPSTGGTTGSTAEPNKPATGGTTKPTTPSTTTPKPPAGDPCDACKAAAASGNATGVQAAINRCTDAGKQAECRSALSRTAVSTIQSTARNGNCDRAKALVAAAEAAGVKGAARGLNGTSCK